MAEFFSSFPSLDIKPQQAMSASDIINIGRTGIQYQKESQANNERVALQGFMSDPRNFQDDSGNIDMSKVNAAIPKIAPMTGADVVKNLADLSTAQTNATKAKQNLTQEQRNLVGQTFNILGKAGIKDRQTYMSALDDLVKTNPENKDLARLADSYKDIWSKLPDNAPFDQLAIRGAQTLLPVSAQETQFNPQAGTVETGAGVMPIVTRPSVADRLHSKSWVRNRWLARLDRMSQLVAPICLAILRHTFAILQRARFSGKSPFLRESPPRAARLRLLLLLRFLRARHLLQTHRCECQPEKVQRHWTLLTI